MTSKKTTMDFKADLQGDGGARTLVLSGRLDVYATDPLISRFGAVVATSGLKSLTVDLAGVTYLDTGGVMALNMLQQKAAGAKVQVGLQGVSPQAQGMMDLIQIDELKPLPPSPSAPPAAWWR